MATSSTFTERIQQWASQLITDLRKRWWWVFIVGPTFAFIWLLLVDRVIGFANKYIDNHLSLSVLRPFVHNSWNSTITKPVFALIAGILVPFAILLVHAYLETRPTGDKPELFAHFVRSHLMPRNALHSMTDQLLKARGRENYEMESDFLFEIFVVNRNPNRPITIKDFICEAKIGENWKRLARINDLTTYQLQKGDDERESTRKDLINFADMTDRIPLTYGIGYRGWLRFELVTDKNTLEKQVFTRLNILDAFGESHPVLPPEPTDTTDGTVVHNPAKILQT